MSATTALRWSLSAALLTGVPLSAAEGTAIPPAGRVTVSGTFRKLTIAITMDVIRIGRDSPCFPQAPEGVQQVSMVKALTIVVGGHEILVPRSVFADWIDLGHASVVDDGGDNLLLSVIGGDGAYSYEIRVFFDATRVTKRTMYSALIPGEPSQETRYWLLVLKDR